MESFWKFVEGHINCDVMRLRLKYHGAHDLPFDVEAAITQIECRQKFSKKLLETLGEYPHFLFPDIISGEQSTSDLLAGFHTTLITQNERVIDLTAGLGIDCLHFAKKASHVTAIEINPLKTEALKKNLGGNAEVVCADCRAFLKAYDGETYDTAFIDPARRAEDGSRVYALDQCEPDVTGMTGDILRIARRLIIKMSPMLDISHTISSLPTAEEFIALGTRNECKELVAVCSREETIVEPKIEAITLLSDGRESRLAFFREEEIQAEATYTVPKAGEYLYEPYPAVMKAAPFRLLSERYALDKLHPNTHLYASKTVAENFPGEISVIKEILPYSSGVIKRIKKTYPKINVAARNFDISADAVRKKLGVKDGGALKITATRAIDGNPILIVSYR